MTDPANIEHKALENAIASLERSIAMWDRLQEQMQTGQTVPAGQAVQTAQRATAGTATVQPKTAGTRTRSAAQTRINVSALQGEIRTRFLELPPHKAMGLVLKSIGVYFRADYAAVHARLGGSPDPVRYGPCALRCGLRTQAVHIHSRWSYRWRLHLFG